MFAHIIKALDRLVWSPYGLRSVMTPARYEAGLGLPNNQNINNFLIGNQTIYILSDLICVGRFYKRQNKKKMPTSSPVRTLGCEAAAA